VRGLAIAHGRPVTVFGEIGFQAIASALIHIIAAGAVTLHVLKRDLEVRAAAGWIGIAWLSPLLGSLVYYVFGINRVTRRAARRRLRPGADHGAVVGGDWRAPHALDEHYRPLSLLVHRVTGEPPTAGNAIEPLRNGDAAYPAMLAAIESARTSVVLCTYIFRDDEAGRPFIAALSRARQRGVEVRVLIDGMGSGYFRSPASRALRRAGIPVARFFHTWVPWRMPYVNMRMHKKLLVVDGAVGFAGGMNIGAENLHAPPAGSVLVSDLHFRIVGPVVRHLFASFAEDWLFETGETLPEAAWCAPAAPAGSIHARGIATGPDEDVAKMETLLLALIGSARRRIRIVTPYFLPERVLLVALSLAALRGVEVEIVLPKRSNHPPMDWAAWAQHRRLVESGCAIHLAPPPFDHTKLMTADGFCCVFGSANWDARSLRLNFEFNVAAVDADFATRVDAMIDAKIAASLRLTLCMIASRSRLAKLRDSLTRLLLPYL
jgi:cardiolipin synthase